MCLIIVKKGGGIIIAYSIPLSPDIVSKVYNDVIIKILRVIGGFCVLLVLSNKYTVLFFPFIWIVLIFAVIQIVQIIIMSIVKIIYGIRKVTKTLNIFKLEIKL